MALLWTKRSRRRVRGTPEASRVRRIVFGVLLATLVILCVYGVWYVARLPSLTISDITIEGGETVSHETVRKQVEKTLTGSYLLLVPRRFAFTYPKEELITGVNGLARVHSARVWRTSLTSIHVTFEEYTPYALWCVSAEESAPCHFIDENGYAFSPAPPLRGGAFVRHVVDGSEPRTGVEAISPDLLRSLGSFGAAVERERGFRISSIRYDASGDIKLFIAGGGMVLIARSMNIEETYQNFQSILGSEEFAHIAPGNFNYIDLRFGNKVFVNEELEPATTTDEAAADEGGVGTSTEPTL